jgi:hypothetical protein
MGHVELLGTAAGEGRVPPANDGTDCATHSSPQNSHRSDTDSIDKFNDRSMRDIPSGKKNLTDGEGRVKYPVTGALHSAAATHFHFPHRDDSGLIFFEKSPSRQLSDASVAVVGFIGGHQVVRGRSSPASDSSLVLTAVNKTSIASSSTAGRYLPLGSRQVP